MSAASQRHAYLPGTLAEIAEVAGLPAALQIADAKGGTRVHIPARLSARHWLITLVGRESAEAICAHFRTSHKRGLELMIPLGPKNFYRRARAQAEEMMQDGASADEIASALGIHRRSVLRYRARKKDMERDTRQGRLF